MNEHGLDKIVAIEPVPRQPALVRVVFQNHDSLDIPSASFVDLSLKIGLPVTHALLLELQEIAKAAAAYEVAIRYLRTRSRTQQEVACHLKNRGIEDNSIQRVINQLVDRGLLNDSKLAEQFYESNRSRMSRLELSWRLRKRGVPVSTVTAFVHGESALANELEAVRIAARKYWNKHRHTEPDKRKLKAAQYLQRKGYSLSLIAKVLEELIDDDSALP